ncbi:acidic mammalian chitinase-like [Cydia splendana]|uniref:acidic mammalian chitinase-like n=1 Tax=Cydia splendana TaxID=1100963 RepID=UPI00300C8E18
MMMMWFSITLLSALMVVAQTIFYPPIGVVVCYYGEGANERTGVGRFGVSDLPTNLCTHIVYSFLLPNGTTGGIIAPEETTYEGKSNSVADLIALKKKNCNLKIMAAIGGWNEGSTNFTALVNDDTLRATLVSNLYNYIDSNGFDGLDLDWEYPAQRGGADSDKVPKNHLLIIIFFFPIQQFLLMKQWQVGSASAISFRTIRGVNAPLYAQLTDDASLNFNVNNSVNVWISNGATPSKLVLGLGAYGKTFTLTSLNNTSTGAPVTGAGAAGPYVAEAGTYSYYEICEDQVNNAAEWNITEVEGNYVYANKDLFWVGYDNPNTIKAKAQYAKTMGLGGIMYWAVDLDDFSGLCGHKYPLISAGIAGYNCA